MKKFALVMGLVLAMGAGFLFITDVSAQSDPWWHPLNPQGGSHGVTYGTNLPTTANTGFPPTDGLLAVQITTGGVPTLNMYDQSNLAWVTFGTLPSGGLTDDTIPVWDATANAFEDSLLTDDGTDITLASGQFLFPDGAVGAPSVAFSTTPTNGMYWINAAAIGFSAGGVLNFRVDTGGILTNNGTAAAPGFAFLSEANSGFYRVDASNIGIAMGGVLVMDWEDTNAAGAGADLVTISSVLGIFDGADTARGLFVDLTNANHTGAGNDLYAIDVDAITEDASAYETGLHLGGGWDTHITFVETGQTPAAAEDYPDAGEIAIFLDDNADYSGGGGNDCCLMGVDSAGTLTVIATFVLNGACP